MRASGEERSRGRGIPTWLSAGLILGTVGALVWLEHRRPLRRRVEPRAAHSARNLAVAAVSAAALQIADRPFTRPLAVRVERNRGAC